MNTYSYVCRLNVIEIGVSSEHQISGSVFIVDVVVTFVAGSSREEEPLLVLWTPASTLVNNVAVCGVHQYIQLDTDRHILHNL